MQELFGNPAWMKEPIGPGHFLKWEDVISLLPPLPPMDAQEREAERQRLLEEVRRCWEDEREHARRGAHRIAESLEELGPSNATPDLLDRVREELAYLQEEGLADDPAYGRLALFLARASGRG